MKLYTSLGSTSARASAAERSSKIESTKKKIPLGIPMHCTTFSDQT
jgi:hypothetical protein